MKTLKITRELRAYSEDEAREFINDFKAKAASEGYLVGANGYTYKCKRAKGEIVDEAWICKCVEIHNEVWD